MHSPVPPFLRVLVVLSMVMPPFMAQAQTPPQRPLNDTGITWSGGSSSGKATECDGAHPAGQDCHYGRDAAAVAGTLAKTGGSALNQGRANGFDFTKVCNSGQRAGQGACPANPELGARPNDWACTRDNVTGLLWEVKTTDGGLRDKDHTYTWYNTGSPDDSPGTPSGGSCATPGRCDTEKYAQDVNASNLCGANDWRMPTPKELESIVDYGRSNPAIDPSYFLNTPSSVVWSGSPNTYVSNYAWDVNFHGGHVGSNFRSFAFGVRLVRGEQ